MIKPGDYEVILFDHLVTIKIDFIDGEDWHRPTNTWEIISIRDDNGKPCRSGKVMHDIEAYIYDVGLIQLLG